MTMAMELIRHIAGLYSGKAIKGDFTQVYITGNEIWMAQQVLAEQAEGAQGHGHVTARVDGRKARCGGPTLCKVCQAEQALAALAQPSQKCPVCKDSGIMGHSDLCVACDTNAQPSPKCATCDDNGRIGGPSFYAPDEGGEPCPDCSQPSPAPELERPEVVGYRSGKTGGVYDEGHFLEAPESLMTVAQHDRIVGVLRFERQQMDRAFTACINERNAAQAKLAELEKREPVAFVVDVQGYKRLICATREEANRNAEHFEKRERKSPIMPLYAAPVAQAGQVPDALREAVEWADHLLFECGALVQTRAPSVHVYNKAFAAIEAAKALLAGAPAQGGE
ncbi:hypothetical protein [Pseudomonas delhiensis]|uniref:hypothetical protein n=1 Tax=Pseudomonas delhiensis TaxID=366289 RepID=UPI00315A3A3C